MLEFELLGHQTLLIDPLYGDHLARVALFHSFEDHAIGALAKNLTVGYKVIFKDRVEALLVGGTLMLRQWQEVA